MYIYKQYFDILEVSMLRNSTNEKFTGWYVEKKYMKPAAHFIIIISNYVKCYLNDSSIVYN